MTRDYLESYLLLERSIKSCEEKLNKYLTTPLKQVHGTVQNSMKEYPYVRTHVTISGSDLQDTYNRDVLIKQLVIELANNRMKYEEMELFIDLWLESLEDLEMKEILSMKYCDGKVDREIAEALNYERSTITKKIDAFFHTIHNAEVV